MLFLEDLKEVRSYIDAVAKEMQHNMYGNKLSNKKKEWLVFCITGIIAVGVVCWKKFELSSGRRRKISSLSWVIQKSKIPFTKIFQASVKLILKRYKVTSGHLIIDDFDRPRSKKTSSLYGVHKTRNKKGGGFIDVQNIVLLVFVSDKISLPVGFQFYRPDPKKKEWSKKDEMLKKAGVSKKERPIKPSIDKSYLPKKQTGIKLLRQFKYNHSSIAIVSILADSAYSPRSMIKSQKQIYPKSQCISQIRGNQNIIPRGQKKIRLNSYFESKQCYSMDFEIRGHLKKRIIFASARLHLASHGKTYHIVAMKYENENKFRYLCATDLTWRAEDIIKAYALRWIVEVAIEDIKVFDGWGREATQQGYDGASGSLCLSLLLDHFLLYHPKQRRLFQTGLSLQTAGSLKLELQFECLFQSIRLIVKSKNPKKMLKKLQTEIMKGIEFRESTKHFCGRDFEYFTSNPHAQRRYDRSG